MIISLIGFMGCGKTHIGKELQKLLAYDFLDLDEIIETQENKTINNIFSEYGENTFREIERNTLEKTICLNEESDLILALGGGSLTNKLSAHLIKEKTLCIYLKASIEELTNNLKENYEKRPMLRGENLNSRILELMNKRKDTYEKCAKITIKVDKLTYKEAAEKIKLHLVSLSYLSDATE